MSESLPKELQHNQLSQHQTHSPNRKWWALIAVSIASFLGCIDFTIVNTALPAIQQDLQVEFRDLQWVINAFILALSSTLVLVGRLADIFGRLKVLSAGLIVFGVASALAGLTTELHWLIAARILQGIGCAVLYTASAAIVANAFEPSEQGKAFGILFAANGIGLAVGPVAGGLITAAWGWQWIFLINVPFIILSLVLSWKNVTESKIEHHNGIDWIGAILLLVALPSLILAIVQGSDWGWTSPVTLAVLSLAVLSLTLFAAVELKVKSPILDLRLFLNSRFVASAVASSSLAVFYCAAFFVMPLYLSIVRHDDINTIGWLLLPTTLGVAFLSPVVGRLVDKKGPSFLFKTGLVLFAVSALIQTTFSATTPVWTLLLAFVVFGVAWAAVLGPSTVQAISSVPQESSSVAVGTLTTLHNIGGCVGLAVGVLIYRHFAAEKLGALSSTPKEATWLQQAVSNPEQAIHLLAGKLNVTDAALGDWVSQSFIAGYQAVMWYLLISVVAALAIIFYALRKPVILTVSTASTTPAAEGASNG